MAELEKILCTDSRIEAAKKINAIVDAMGEGDLANIDLSNLSSAGQAKFDEKAYANEVLKKKQITNCITEIPQNIKLELNNGTLTLKAGSKVIVPNGFEANGTTPKFDYITIDSDKQATRETNKQETYIYHTATGAFNMWALGVTYTSATVPTLTGNHAVWYDTTNNVVKHTHDGGATWTSGCSFPVCLATSDTTQIISIDQVFNGMGYIGSTVWVDKGVKGLAPNGRNADGTLNNIEVVTQEVLTFTFASNITTQPNTSRAFINQTGTGLFARIGSYDDENNYILGANGVEKLFGCIFAENGTVTKGVVDSFDFKLPFRAVDYNEFAKSINTLSKAYITETYVSGTSGYRVWSDGYCEQWGRATLTNGSVTTVSLLKNYANINYNIHLEIRQDGFTSDKWMPYINAEPTVSSFVVKNSTSSTTILMWCTAGYVS